MENKVLKKILVIAIVFMLTFSNCGFTLQALATSEGISFLGFNLFGGNELEFKAYFLDENGKEKESNIADVNSEAILVVELEPNAEGYLKRGTIEAIAEEGETNFEIQEVIMEQDNQDSEDVLTQVIAPDTLLLKTAQTVNVAENNHVEQNAATDNENVVNNTVETLLQNTTIDSNNVDNTVLDVFYNNAMKQNIDNTTNTTNIVDNPTVTTNTTNDSTNTDEILSEKQEELIDEDAVANEKIEEEKEELEKVINAAEVTVVSGNKIEIKNVIEATKLYVKLQFKAGEKLDISDLYKTVKLNFSGKYINVDLEEVDIFADKDLEIGWSYSKDIIVASEYTKVSPFEVSGIKGTLVENKIIVNRNIEDDKYLPVKQTKIEIQVPELNGKKPLTMEVNANKLKATKGEEINEVIFTKDNWEYNAETNILSITVENSDANYTYGEDIYVVTYRYEDYVEDSEIELPINTKVTVEEYSAKENNTITKNIESNQKIIVNVGELITYSIGTTEEKISKGRINANYNSAEAIYETEFTSTVNVNILTNDVLNEFTLKDTKEFYIDKQNLEFEATDVKYKKIAFKYGEIAELLEKGGNIEIKSNSGELLYTLNSDLIKSQDDCTIEIRGDVTGVEISFRNISVNGNIAVDFIKAIGKCNYDKSAFNSFEKIESRIKAEVKYMSAETTTELPQIKTEKYFEDSITRARINLNKDSLSTLENNQNVEIKIELNNHVETSDLYSNPVFEIVFPEYVNNVEAKATNLLYEDELKVKNTTVFVENGIVRMQVALEGTQTKFSTGNLSNGTNIIINTNIEVDDYAPKVEDQIRMYYYNESVSNYESQTKWTVKGDIPTGILKSTNGFDVDVFSYQAPSGFVAVNEIVNYDGQNTKVFSIEQGEETREVAMEKEAQVATMNLIAMNNTGNDCTDVVLLGRIPNTEATDVNTGEKLGNNIDTAMASWIIPDANNPVSARIYYSENPVASKDLADGRNGWTETLEDLSKIKSFLIVPTDKVLKGMVFKYSYNFQIPGNLPYESAMYGAFGSFYNNHSEVAVMYETSVADKVGLITKAGPKLEAVMTVDIGDGADILEQRMMTYTITVKNTGSVDLENIEIVNDIPRYTRKCAPADSLDSGDNGYTTSNDSSVSWTIDKMTSGEIIEKKFIVRTTELPTLLEYCHSLGEASSDETGYYYLDENNEKVYVTEVPEEIYVENKAKIKIGNLATEVETNTVKNRLLDANFDIETTTYKSKTYLSAEDSFDYVISVKNIAGKTLNNVIIEDYLPKEVQMNSIKYLEDNTYEYDSETNKLQIFVNSIEADDIVRMYVNCTVSNVKNIGSAEMENQVVVYADENIKEFGTKILDEIKGPNLVVYQDSSVGQDILEYENFNIIVNVQNKGKGNSKKVNYKIVLPEELEALDVNSEGNREVVKNIIGNVITGEVSQIDAEKYNSLVIKVRPKLLPDSETSRKISVLAEVTEEYIGALEVTPLEINILQNPLNPETDEEKQEEEKNNTVTNPEENDSYLEDIKNTIESENNNNLDTDIDIGLDENDSSENKEHENNNSSDNNESNNNNSVNTETKEENKTQNVQANKVKIHGQVWLDANKDGKKDDSEKYISKVKVQLQKSGSTIKAVTTDSTGTYRFEDLPEGKYSLLFEYDSNKYVATTYKKQDVSEDTNSDAIELTDGQAISNNFEMTMGEQKVDLGLQDRNDFDITIHKYITKAIVKTNNKEKVYEYDNADLAKLEIRSKELKNTEITFEYKIVVENVGNVSGEANSVVDYLPNGLTFNQEVNNGWTLNEDGTLYNNTMKDVEIKPGEKKEFKLVLNKKMTEDNTGVISNKVGVLDLSTKLGIKEDSSNNEATQEIIVTVSTGRTAQIIFIFIIAILAFLAGYGTKTGKINLSKINLNKNFKRVYK